MKKSFSTVNPAPPVAIVPPNKKLLRPSLEINIVNSPSEVNRSKIFSSTEKNRSAFRPFTKPQVELSAKKSRFVAPEKAKTFNSSLNDRNVRSIIMNLPEIHLSDKGIQTSMEKVKSVFLFDEKKITFRFCLFRFEENFPREKRSTKNDLNEKRKSNEYLEMAQRHIEIFVRRSAFIVALRRYSSSNNDSRELDARSQPEKTFQARSRFRKTFKRRRTFAGNHRALRTNSRSCSSSAVEKSRSVKKENFSSSFFLTKTKTRTRNKIQRNSRSRKEKFSSSFLFVFYFSIQKKNYSNKKSIDHFLFLFRRKKCQI